MKLCVKINKPCNSGFIMAFKLVIVYCSMLRSNLSMTHRMYNVSKSKNINTILPHFASREDQSHAVKLHP